MSSWYPDSRMTVVLSGIEKLGENEERKLIFRHDEYLVWNTNQRSSNTNLGLKKSGLEIHVW